MIPVVANHTEFDTIPGEEVAFTISQANMNWVMKSLTDLYSNKPLAVTREYSTNAWDEHVKAGITLPLDITLPDSFNPYFIVRDFGEGMDHGGLVRTYTEYGESGKRDSNDYNGVLGFGSKSALTYTNSFTVRSIKNGVQTTAIFTRKSDDSLVMKVVDTRATDEPSGTEVRVPVSDPELFTKIASDFYAFWPSGTLNIDGVLNEQKVGEKITDRLYRATGEKSYVVMGNVAYPIANPSALFKSSTLASKTHFVAFVENGTVEFAPSREALMYTDLTNDTLKKVVAEYEAEIIATAKKEVESAKTRAEAVERRDHWQKILGTPAIDSFKFGGKEVIPFTIDLPVGSMIRTFPKYGQGTTSGVRGLAMSDVHRTVIVTDFTILESTTVRKAVKEYAKEHGLWDGNPSGGWYNSNQVIFVKTNFTSDWVSPVRVITWKDLRESLPKEAKNSAFRRQAGTFDLVYPDRIETEQELPELDEYLFFSTADQSAGDIKSRMKIIGLTDPVIVLTRNRWEKFTRDFGAKHFNTKAKDFVTAELDSIDWNAIATVDAMQWRTEDFINSLDAAKVDDPELKEMINAYRTGKAERVKASNVISLCRSVGVHVPSGTGKVLNPYRGYGLLRNANLDKSNMAEVYWYLNARYASRKDSK